MSIVASAPVVAPLLLLITKLKPPEELMSPEIPKSILAFPPMLPPVFSIDAASEPPVEMLAALTLIVASPPNIPPPFKMVKLASLTVVRVPPTSKWIIELESITPLLVLLMEALTEAAVRSPPVVSEIFPPVPMCPPLLVCIPSVTS